MLIKTDTREIGTELEELAHISQKPLFKIALHNYEIVKATQTEVEIENQCGPAGPPIDERDLGARMFHTQNKESSSITNRSFLNLFLLNVFYFV